jgi:hypothetical protein
MHNQYVSKKEKSRELRAAMRYILMQNWDPIGVKEVPEAADEYDMYIGDVYDLLKRGASDNEISNYLVKVETEGMGLSDGNGKPLLPTVIRQTAIHDLQSIREKFLETSTL